MADGICKIDGCELPIRNHRGWCNPHYLRWRRYGDPLGSKPRISLEDRFRRQIDKSGPIMPGMVTECWLWTGCQYPTGYGKFRAGGAHRFSYQLEHGPLDKSFVVDHECRNPLCVRIDHLRCATPKQNAENRGRFNPKNRTSGIRGVSWIAARSKWQATVCHLGKSISAGTYDSIDDAEAAVVALRNRLFTHNQLDR